MHWQPIALLIAFAPVPAERPPGAKLAKEVAALERKLHGQWRGQGACVGDITFHPDGKYERAKQGPGGTDSEAAPVASTATGAASGVPLEKKVTVPVGVVPPETVPTKVMFPVLIRLIVFACG